MTCVTQRRVRGRAAPRPGAAGQRRSGRAFMTMSFSENWCAHCCRAASAALMSAAHHARGADVSAGSPAGAARATETAAVHSPRLRPRAFLDVAECDGLRLELGLQRLERGRHRAGAEERASLPRCPVHHKKLTRQQFCVLPASEPSRRPRCRWRAKNGPPRASCSVRARPRAARAARSRATRPRWRPLRMRHPRCAPRTCTFCLRTTKRSRAS